MSNIDSGLGWSCDSDYYVGTAGTLVTYPNGTITKSNSGGCIIGAFYNPATYAYGLVGISTISENLVTTYDSFAFSGGDSIGSATVNGVTWYIVHIWNNNSSYASSSSYLNNYSIFSFNAQTASLEERVRDILSEANVQSAALKIPTADFIKLFIEGVEAETATRVNALDTAKQPKTMSTPLTIGGTQQTTVEGALSALNNAGGSIASKADLTSITEIGSTASQAISSNTFFYLNGVLVRALTDIASGAAFTQNTNYEEVSAGGLNALQSGGGGMDLLWTRTTENPSATGVLALSINITGYKLFFVGNDYGSTLVRPGYIEYFTIISYYVYGGTPHYPQIEFRTIYIDPNSGSQNVIFRKGYMGSADSGTYPFNLTESTTAAIPSYIYGIK